MSPNDIKELSIQVSLNGLSFCILNRTSNEIEYLNRLDFDSKLVPFDLLNRLKTELSVNTVFTDAFKEVLVVHQNELSTLIPSVLYNENYKADYLKFNSKILKTDFLATDDLSINNSVNIYVPYVNINNYIFDTFGSFTYKHSSTILIDAILQNNNSTNEEQVFINVNSNTIDVLVYNNKTIQLINIFEYYTKNDFIYYILFVFEQLQLNTETTQVALSGKISEGDDLFTILYTYVRHVHLAIPQNSFTFNESIDVSMHLQHFLILNSF